MAKPGRAQRREDLKATAESLLEDAKHVARIEEEKLGLEIDDPRLDKLSIEAERTAVQIQHKSRLERQIAEEEPDAADGGQSRRN